MRRQQRPARLELDGPEAVELDRRLVTVGQRRSLELCGDVEVEWRAGLLRRAWRRQVPIPVEGALIAMDVAGQGNEKARCHRIHERWALLDGADVAAVEVGEGGHRHPLQ